MQPQAANIPVLIQQFKCSPEYIVNPGLVCHCDMYVAVEAQKMLQLPPAEAQAQVLFAFKILVKGAAAVAGSFDNISHRYTFKVIGF